MSVDKPTEQAPATSPAQAVFSARLSPAALARLDASGGRSAGLRAAIEAVAAGNTPAGPGPRDLTPVSARVDQELLEQARAAASARIPPLNLTQAVEAVLLAE